VPTECGKTQSIPAITAPVSHTSGHYNDRANGAGSEDLDAMPVGRVAQVPDHHSPQEETEESIDLTLVEPAPGVEELAHHRLLAWVMWSLNQSSAKAITPMG
jgi:hypothetical protein